MDDTSDDARVAAIWVLHGNSCARLLRAHGRDRHAEQLEEAFAEVTEIVAATVGREALTRALDWAADEMWPAATTEPGSATRH